MDATNGPRSGGSLTDIFRAFLLTPQNTDHPAAYNQNNGAVQGRAIAVKRFRATTDSKVELREVSAPDRDISVGTLRDLLCS